MVVDRDPACPARRLASARVLIETATWNEWLAANLSSCSADDHLVPYHWAPHVLLNWLASDLERHGVTLKRDPDSADPPARPPVLRETAGGDLALSYATWLCPPACIEPALCPHTRGPRTWSLATELAQASESYVFPCLHLAYGVGTIPVAAIFDVRDRILTKLGQGATGVPTYAWVGSASHCHGLAARVRL